MNYHILIYFVNLFGVILGAGYRSRGMQCLGSNPDMICSITCSTSLHPYGNIHCFHNFNIKIYTVDQFYAYFPKICNILFCLSSICTFVFLDFQFFFIQSINFSLRSAMFCFVFYMYFSFSGFSVFFFFSTILHSSFKLPYVESIHLSCTGHCSKFCWYGNG